MLPEVQCRWIKAFIYSTRCDHLRSHNASVRGGWNCLLLRSLQIALMKIHPWKLDKDTQNDGLDKGNSLFLKRWALVGIYVRFLWLFPCFDEIYSAAFYWQTLSRLNGSWSCISWTRCKTRRFSPMRPFGIWGKKISSAFFSSPEIFLGIFSRWWDSNIVYFHNLPWEDFQFDWYFSKGLKPPPSFEWSKTLKNCSNATPAFMFFFFACLRSSQLLQCGLVPKDLQWAVSANWGWCWGGWLEVSPPFFLQLSNFSLRNSAPSSLPVWKRKESGGQMRGNKMEKITPKSSISQSPWLVVL